MGTLNSDSAPGASSPSRQEPPESAVVTPLPPRRRRQVLFALLTVALCVAFLPPLFAWQQMGEERALSLSNLRRLSSGALLYAQDWDACTMPPSYPVDAHFWQTWPSLLRPYVSPDSTFSDPSNPVLPFHSAVREPGRTYPVNSSYALNRRFWNTFGPGPFPLANLELPEQTALFVEAGPMWKSPYRPNEGRPLAFLEYGDTMDRYGELYPYPSPHDGRMAVVAADGHGTILKVVHYDPKDGPHDTLYGRIANSIYNWNGGHPNGETDRPPRE